ncbi:putative clathrin assembly protein At5g35200 [Silene latifolia]|uniref:putative clathrin assembly protein At5g35200 n=1 Tax=Silene latifolia TaxID=37657 RepID=UPI003D77E590
MMARGGTNSSLRKYVGSIKDTTTISLAKVNSGYKELDIAIVKATNHVERPAKERHIRAIFAAVSATRSRDDVAYCIHALARRLAKTRNWAVALKTLIVIHRALREADPTFLEELINYGRSRNHMLNMSHFKDDSSASAWDYSGWVRAYALFLEERLECSRVLKYDVETERPRTKDLDLVDLLKQLPALQQLLHRVLGCQPEGAAAHNHVIQLALSMVASESMKIFSAIGDGTVNLVDKFFEMQRHDALKALDIYRKAGQQAERLSELYESCKSLDVGRGEKFIKIEQPPSSFLQAMEEYVKEAPRGSTFQKEQVKHMIEEKSTVVLSIEDADITDAKEEQAPSPLPEPVKEEKPVAEVPDLLSMDEPNPLGSYLDEKNALALAIITTDDLSTTAPTPNLQDSATGWELALVTAPSSNGSATAATNLAGGLDKLTLDSLYDDAMRRNNEPTSYNPWEQASMIPSHNPFFNSNSMAAPHCGHVATMSNQQQPFLLHQQMMMGPQHQSPTMNPFGNPNAANAYGPGIPVQAYNPYTSLL